MPRTQVPEEDQRVTDVAALKNLTPRPQAVVRTEGESATADGLANLYWWDPNGDAPGDGTTTIESSVPGFTDGDANEGLWRRMVQPNSELVSGNAGAVQYSDGSGGLNANDQYLYVDDVTGEVGINTNSPSNLLSINANGNDGEGLEINDTNGNLVGEMRNNGGDFNFRAGSGKKIGFGISGTGGAEVNIIPNSHTEFGVSGTEEMRLNSTGLGIGTNSPTARLHVEENLSSGGDQLVNLQAHRGFDIIRAADGNSAVTANLALNGRTSGNYWEITHDQNIIAEFNEGGVGVFKRGANRALDVSGGATVSGDFDASGETNTNTFEVRDFGSLGGDDTGDGVYTNGFRAYIGLIPLVNSGDKEFVSGKVVGARESFDNGGEFIFGARNDPFNDGLDITLTGGFVHARKNAEGRLVQFDHNGNTWVGIEIIAGGSGINQENKFIGRTISDSGNGDTYPKQVDFSNLSNLSAFSGRQDDMFMEISDLKVFGTITATDDIRSEQDVIAFYSSDRRHKTSIEPVGDALTKIDQMSGYKFDWNEDFRRDGTEHGFIAQEVQKVLPEAVNERDDGTLAVDYRQTTPLLTNAIKELREKVDKQEEKINELQNKIEQ